MYTYRFTCLAKPNEVTAATASAPVKRLVDALVDASARMKRLKTHHASALITESDGEFIRSRVLS
jgi:hypothetical protein